MNKPLRATEAFRGKVLRASDIRNGLLHVYWGDEQPTDDDPDGLYVAPDRWPVQSSPILFPQATRLIGCKLTAAPPTEDLIIYQWVYLWQVDPIIPFDPTATGQITYEGFSGPYGDGSKYDGTGYGAFAEFTGNVDVTPLIEEPTYDIPSVGHAQAYIIAELEANAPGVWDTGTFQITDTFITELYIGEATAAGNTANVLNAILGNLFP